MLGRPLKTSWLTIVLYYALLVPLTKAYLVVERRFQGHLQSQEPILSSGSISEDFGSRSAIMIDVETLAEDVATGVTYFLKNVHDRMVITNISIKDSFVASDLRFDAVHGRSSNLVGGIERAFGNSYVDEAIQEQER